MRKPFLLCVLGFAKVPVARLQRVGEGDIKIGMRFVAGIARAREPNAEGFGDARVVGLF